MKIAFPSNENNGIDSQVYNHFGSAKLFIITDSGNENTEVVFNQDLDHEHNNCQPLKALGRSDIDVVVVAGIGGGALRKLNASNIKVYKAVDGNVKENLEKYISEDLTEFTPNLTCGGHGPGGDCFHVK
ncbi:MAG: diguanylate cyclase [Desulfobacterales bacterium]|jgi:predicted Fe-Mo cluster-binding NifX family protein|nr:diguanylate cyclase [Desulfobacterales bacterium]